MEGVSIKRISKGEKLDISANGQQQNIVGDVKVKVKGAREQSVTSGILISSEKDIKIKSATKVFIDSPVLERSDVDINSFATNSSSIYYIQFSATSLAMAGKIISYAYTSVDVAHKSMAFGRSLVNAQRVEGARVESGSLKRQVLHFFAFFKLRINQ